MLLIAASAALEVLNDTKPYPLLLQKQHSQLSNTAARLSSAAASVPCNSIRLLLQAGIIWNPGIHLSEIEQRQKSNPSTYLHTNFADVKDARCLQLEQAESSCSIDTQASHTHHFLKATTTVDEMYLLVAWSHMTLAPEHCSQC